jgi:hypothetical protein
MLINVVDWALYFEPRRPQRKNMLAHLADWKVTRIKDGIQRMIWQK